MAAKTSDWRPGPSVCRCCFAEGCYKDISTEYFWMGKREVYSEMLTETFDVTIGYAQTGGPNSNSRLICEPCIARLRDASDFKRQVQECEKVFQQHLAQPSSSSLEFELPATSEKEEIKLELVKEEAKLDEDDDFDDQLGYPDDDDDDDMDDEPLTKLASKVPKQESDEMLRSLLMDDSRKLEKRKSSTKAKASPAKKAKKKESPKPSVSKPAKVVVEKKKKDKDAMARHNARIIIENATAYPFRLPESSAVCVFCYEAFEDPSLFRRHMEDDHKNFKSSIAFAHIHEGYLKVDITDLRCRICENPIPSLEEVAKHLIDYHNLSINLGFDLGLQPFAIEKDRWWCALCNEKFNNLRSLSRHTAKHFSRYTCNTCGKSYPTASAIKMHEMGHQESIANRKLCRRCRKTFDSNEELRIHMEESKRCCMHVCNICGERFATWILKQNHKTELHAVPKKTYSCSECDKVFDNPDSCRTHYKIIHTDDYLQCSCCGMKFVSEYKLRRHMVSHTGEKDFTCSVCTKAFPRKSTLDQHMWIHRPVKKWQCLTCDKQFNQRVSWKTHMKAHHPDQCNF